MLAGGVLADLVGIETVTNTFGLVALIAIELLDSGVDRNQRLVLVNKWIIVSRRRVLDQSVKENQAIPCLWSRLWLMIPVKSRKDLDFTFQVMLK